MRHVVLGANTFVGQFIIKLLVTIGEGIEIIAVSTDGSIATDVATDLIEIQMGSILDPLNLYTILEKDDIVYNAEVQFEEIANVETIELTNHLGLVNLLGVASLIGVRRIVSVLPQLVGWDISEVNNENSTQGNPDSAQEITVNTLEMIENYWKRRDYGWNSRNIRAWARQNIESPKYPITFYKDEDIDYDPETDDPNEIEVIGDLSSEQGSVTMDSPSAPNLNATHNLNEAPIAQSPPNLTGTPEGKSLENVPNNEEIVFNTEDNKSEKNNDPVNVSIVSPDTPNQSNSNNEGDSDEIIESGSDENEKQALPAENDESELSPTELFWLRQEQENVRRKKAQRKIEEELAKVRSDRQIKELQERERRKRELTRVPLVIARFGRIFGAYDRNLSLKFCDAIKRGKLEIVGEMKEKISWITPVDIGRAMIIIGDKSVPQGQYMLNSFTASPREILLQLDQINASNLKLTVISLEKEMKKIRNKKIIARLGFRERNKAEDLLKYNIQQVFSDEKAIKRWKWFPRYNFEQACEDAFQWYFEVIVPELYPLR